MNADAIGASARRLREAVAAVTRRWPAPDRAATARRPAPGKWCAREVLGHLIDSACNNHRRFVVGQWDEAATFDKYAQDEWVARQRHADAEWSDLLALWRAYNLRLASVLERMAEPARGSQRLRFLAEDYVDHLEHHMAQIAALLGD
jgi:hypothetical protein